MTPLHPRIGEEESFREPDRQPAGPAEPALHAATERALIAKLFAQPSVQAPIVGPEGWRGTVPAPAETIAA